MRVGIISDTHGLLRPEAIAALAGSDLIIHAGDVGHADVLARLGKLAPVHAVRGNIDTQPWAQDLPDTTVVRAGRRGIFVLHDIAHLDINAAAACDAIVYGHSHRASAEIRDGFLFLNPGSAGPRRFRLPVTVATLEISLSTLRPEVITLG